MTYNGSIPFGRPWITDDDRKAVLDVLDQSILTDGPQCEAFEEEFAAFVGDGAHCVAVSSCAAALHMCYLALGLGPGDEVIVPSQTHVATVNAVEWIGATPVFVDCDPATGNVRATDVGAAVTPRTRALSVVHFVGIPCDMPSIMAMAERHGLSVIEDCALAVGSRFAGRHAGLYGDAGCFSFYPVKHIATGEGGMVATRRPEIARKVRRLRAHGTDRTGVGLAIPGMYDVPWIGLNYRMSELQAALGRSQLGRIEENLEMRRANFEALRDALSGTPTRVLDAEAPDAASSHYCASVVLASAVASRRDDVVRGLNEAGIGTSVYYPQPVPRMTYYRTKYGYESARFPNAEVVSDRSVALPVGPHVTRDEARRIGETLAAVIGEVVP